MRHFSEQQDFYGLSMDFLQNKIIFAKGVSEIFGSLRADFTIVEEFKGERKTFSFSSSTPPQ